jgi:hypothetical protein
VLIHPRRRLPLFRELKSAGGQLRPEQAAWLEALEQALDDAEAPD